MDYRSQFLKLARRSPGFDKQAKMSCFISGLREDIRVDVRAARPTSLLQAIDLAMVFETRYGNTRNPYKNIIKSSLPFPTNQHHQPKSSNPSPPKPLSSSGNKTPWQLKKVSEAEWQECREKKLCVACRGPFRPGHSCPQLKSLFVEGYVMSNTAEEAVEEPLLLAGPDEEQPLIQLNAIAQLHSFSNKDRLLTIQVKGTVAARSGVHILIDPGATHNFIHPKLSKQCKLQITENKNLRAIVASGEVMQSQGCIEQLPVNIQGYELIQDFYVLPISGCEMILEANGS